MSNGLDASFDCPLETRLQELVGATNSHHEFPHTGSDRFELYKSIKIRLQQDYYRDIDGGLTSDSNGGAFTRHDLGHVNDVIRKAGQVLGVGSESTTPAVEQLKPFEIFVLLVACLIHDAGNVDGRKGHGGRARGVLARVSNSQLDQKEISLISKIAQAHGGRTLTGSKDTINQLKNLDGVDQITVRPKLLAAILRLSDELAENSKRANTRDEETSRFPNLFCKIISVGVDYSNRRISLDFAVANNICSMHGKDENGEEMYFLDYISKRVAKTELERRYCDRFLRGICTFEETRVEIEFLHDDIEWNSLHFEMQENGYPSADDLDLVRDKLINAQDIADQYQQLLSKGSS